MSKLSRISALALLLALPLFGSGCDTMQPPSPSQTLTGPNGNNPNFLDRPSTSTSGEDINGGLAGRDTMLGADFNIDNPPADAIVVTVYFGFDQYNIQSSERAKLIDAAKRLSADPSANVIAVGHTDWFGSDQYNLVLSDRRSNSVKSFLGSNGANAGMVQILARGKIGATPDVKKDSPEAKHDRRVDLVKVPASYVPPEASMAGGAGGPAAAVAP